MIVASPRMALFVALIFALTATHTTNAFLAPPALRHERRQHSFPSLLIDTTTTTTTTTTRLFMAVNTNDDPFVILNLNPTSDKREIKRAYKRMALKCHPDVVCSSTSTKEERKEANDKFAQINWAYEQLSGKNGSTTATSSTSSYTPPHRRKSTTSYTTTTPSGSTDWRDYIPNYKEDEQYDTDGDSFSKIFSDLVTGAAGVAAAGAGASGGIFRDLVEFLEMNVDGYTTGGTDDSADDDLYTLLTYGSLEEVGMEMDDTELVVQSLEAKQKNVADELLMKTADSKFATKFSEKVELEALVDELKARKRVVDGYLTKARKRLTKLQTRYKELIVGGESGGGGYSRTSYEPSSSRSTSSYSSRSSSSTSSTGSGRRASTSTAPASGPKDDQDEWKHQGFGSSGSRGRGSSRRAGRARQQSARSSSASSSSSSSYGGATPPPPPRQETTTTPPPRQETSSSYESTAPQTSPPRRESTSRQSTSSEDWKPPVPPHRRTTSQPSQAQKDKKRLRELQVDEEFDKLKKDLGL